MNDSLVSEVVAGIHAGAIEAVKRARHFGTNLVISRDGKIIEITPDEAEALLKKSEAQKDQK